MRRNYCKILFAPLLALAFTTCKSTNSHQLKSTAASLPKTDWTSVEDIESSVRTLSTRYAEEGRILTRNEFLQHLPEDYKSRYTVLKSSDASEYVDDSDPTDARIIAFGNDPRLTIAWVKNSDGIQIAQDRGTHLELKEIEFPSSKDDQVKISAPNPKGACGGVSCHGADEDPQYIWDAYPQWPGAFAADNDFIKTIDEARAVKLFYESAKSNPAFSMLKQNYAYRQSLGTFRLALPKDAEGYEEFPKEDTKYGTSYQYRPNTFLTLAYSRIHTRHLFLKIKSSPHYQELRTSLLFVLNRCDVKSQEMARKVDRHLKQISKGRSLQDDPPSITSGLNETLWMPWFELLGTTAAQWKLSKAQRPFYNDLPQDHLYNEGFTSLAYLVGGMIGADLAKDDQEWAPLFLRGTLAEFEESYFGGVNYFDRSDLEAQVSFLDELGVFLNTEDRNFLRESRPDNYNEMKAKSCDYLERSIRSRFRI